MENPFFDKPILNSPYKPPTKHWELDETGQPTQKILEKRRKSEFISPIPKAKKQKKTASGEQQVFGYQDVAGVSNPEQQYFVSQIINSIREKVAHWRALPNPKDWKVTPETARLLQHWRHHDFSGVRPFFCQVEAVETVIWLTEVASRGGKEEKSLTDHLVSANREANPDLMRLALKLATGAGKTTVMAMLIAWQTLNAVRRPSSDRFTKGFLIVTPGLTIKDRLRVLMPNDPEKYYANRELVPQDLLPEMAKAKIVITNYHAFKLRDRLGLSKGNRSLLQGRGEAINSFETEGQMLKRLMPELMGMKNILAINDEAHHCYRAKPGAEEIEDLKGEEKDEAKENNEAARLWISGLEIVKRNLGLVNVIDLSATPFFLRGSGYAEGTLFPWTMSDFSLMDAIECGIVKLPRVPVADNLPGTDSPVFRNLWDHIGKKMPKKGRGQSAKLDPLNLPLELQSALEALYGHYAETFELWQLAKIEVPPCFIVVCNNTSTSKLVYDYISGFNRDKEDGSTEWVPAHLELFSNFDADGNPYPRPKTLLIDSEQLESGEALDEQFRNMAAGEIEAFRREIVERTGDRQKAEGLTDQDLLREVMNTVGKEGKLGGEIRCVVSVSMLTEGWDANTVTHVLGVRAFGTQLLCEQVIGRALRRQSYDLNEEGLFNVEYADVLGIPFDFTAKPVVGPPQPPRKTIQVKAMRPERDSLEIRFPRVLGYRVELPEERLTATFTADSEMVLTPDLVGPTRTRNEGIIGEAVDLNLDHLEQVRPSTLLMNLTNHLLFHKFRSEGEEPKLHLFGQLKRITKEWLDSYLVCKGKTYPALLMYKELADRACEKISAAITRSFLGTNPILAVLDSYNPIGTTAHVNFNTSKESRWATSSERCHLNWVILDSDWEGEFCRAAEAHPKVKAYVKNHNLGLEVPYQLGATLHHYRPDFIVLVDDGRPDPLHLIVEIKGFRGEDAKVKKQTMETYWVPGVNYLGRYGRWAFAEFRDVYEIEADFEAKIEAEFNQLIQNTLSAKE
ncbi:MAG: restriction endonuclease [Candidatus Lambdaproteobacteria bacterium RIFOXYD1_FULL_56_27]|uniref:Restriction endonuclease n=1 Tax=Candidatus Lambdaproteobacteria bacterium RIFOXYD2_FULL_56_26 TaxID=1817773 RepID=A0A1F6GQQ2_9PROT|nr:MAG: restriction endonuclease [Candidatus Lambdaproteobacteria bacterium RIFOXYD2_FULL_56_26]OGH04102.1 MAG: restriction endonuclease [Candidatus Lambdaproteobacteria bacterium RIFOXYC1_FULL_56_13]OGH06381.1 MAG: restriction endonuclease [Candidatus Lambdaproteobacteria bacterium RIFOXYD1_FULL_56_27]